MERQGDAHLVGERLLPSDDDVDGACSRAYSAIFSAAHVALFKVGSGKAATATKTHRGIIALFSRDVMRPGHVPADLGKALDRVEQLRLTADRFETSVPPDRVIWAMGRAEAMLAAADAMARAS